MLRIRSADIRKISAVTEFCRNSITGTKTVCQINAYGLERNFLNVWVCENDEEEILAVISKFEDSITLTGCPEDYTDDVRTFLDMIGFSSLCCNGECALKLSYRETVSKKGYVYTGDYSGEIFGNLTEDSYKDSYMLISKSIPDSFSDTKEAYLSFLSDFTFRHRRSLARIKGCVENGKVLSCALTSAETECSAVISGVACDNVFRKKGFGKKTVLSLAQELKSEGKEVYVIALNEAAEGFYEHIGFVFKEKISFIERK